jgi:predicted AAA+ superfamily ATPase
MNIKEIIKDVILSGFDKAIPVLQKRALKIETMPGKATVLMGVRRSGKSTYFYQLINKILEAGVVTQNILMINFVDERLHFLSKENLGLILEVYYGQFPEKLNEKVFFFFDEIQEVDGWEFFIERILRSENAEVYITGSSAKLLSKEIGTQMRGRSLSWEMFPLSFKEYLDFKNIDRTKLLSPAHKLMIGKSFGEYWESGGFPEVIHSSADLRIRVLQDYYHSILYRDIIERYNLSNPKAVKDIAHYLLCNIGSMYSVNRLTNHMKTRGHKTSRESIASYLDWFEDTYFLFSVGVYDVSVNKRAINPKKIYCIDHAFVKAVVSNIQANRGHLLENLVFVSLRHKYQEIFYYHTTNGLEVDFLIINSQGEKELVQVCESLFEEKTRKREVNALQCAMKDFSLKKALIITLDEFDEILFDDCVIKVVPIWQYLYED